MSLTAWRLVDPSARAFRESVAPGSASGHTRHPRAHRRDLCSRGRTRLCHVHRLALSALALLHDAAALTGVACDDAGWSDGGLERSPTPTSAPGTARTRTPRGRPLARDHRAGGANAIRRILARLRADAPFTTGRSSPITSPTCSGGSAAARATLGLRHRDLVVEGEAPPDPAPSAITATRPALAPSRPRPGGRLARRRSSPRTGRGSAPRPSRAPPAPEAACSPLPRARSSAALALPVPRWAAAATVAGTITAADPSGAKTRAVFSVRVCAPEPASRPRLQPFDRAAVVVEVDDDVELAAGDRLLDLAGALGAREVGLDPVLDPDLLARCGVVAGAAADRRARSGRGRRRRRAPRPADSKRRRRAGRRAEHRRAPAGARCRSGGRRSCRGRCRAGRPAAPSA